MLASACVCACTSVLASVRVCALVCAQFNSNLRALLNVIGDAASGQAMTNHFTLSLIHLAVDRSGPLSR